MFNPSWVFMSHGSPWIFTTLSPLVTPCRHLSPCEWFLLVTCCSRLLHVLEDIDRSSWTPTPAGAVGKFTADLISRYHEVPPLVSRGLVGASFLHPALEKSQFPHVSTPHNSSFTTTKSAVTVHARQNFAEILNSPWGRGASWWMIFRGIWREIDPQAPRADLGPRFSRVRNFGILQALPGELARGDHGYKWFLICLIGFMSDLEPRQSSKQSKPDHPRLLWVKGPW